MAQSGTLTIKIIFYITLAAGTFGASKSFSAPTALTYQGRIVKADGLPLTYNNVSFQFEITNPAGTCVLYREQVNGVNMQNSNGIFDVAIGNSHSYPASASFTILDSFSNSAPLSCDGGAPFTPAATDGRRLRVQFYDGTSWRLISPDSIIRSVPYSGYSANSGKLGNYVATDYVRKNQVNGNATCAGGSFLTWDAMSGSFGCDTPSGGTGSITQVQSSNSYITVANSTTTPTITLNVGTAANTVAAGNDPRLSNSRPPTGSASGDLTGSFPSPTVAAIQGVAVDATTPSSGQVLKYNGSSWTAATLPAGNPGTVTQVQSANSYVSVSNATTTPTITLNVGTIANTVAAGNDPRFSDSRSPNGAAAGDLSGTYPNPSVAKIQGVAIDPASPTSGQVLQFNGLSWIPTSLPATSSGTVTNVQSANSYITVANSTTSPTLTLNVGTVANTVAAGNDSRFTDSRPPNGSAGGDLAGTFPSPSVAKIQGVSVDPTAPTSGQVLKYDGTSWIAATLPAGNVGTVTSITAGPGLTGGSITSSGTIGLDTELTGLAGMATTGYLLRSGTGTYSTTTGSTTASTDTLVVRDGTGVTGFYGVDIHGSTSGIISFLAPNITTSYSLTFPGSQGGVNQVLQNNGSGQLNWASVPTAPGSNCGANEVITFASGAFTCVPDQTGSAGTGITTFNGQTGSSQSFGAIGTTGTSPAWSSASSVHTLNIPMANTTSVTAGLISKAEYDVFNGKQSALGYTPLRPSNNLNDVANVTTARSNLGLGTAATRNVAAAGNAASTEVVLGNDTRLTDGRAPTGTAGGDLSGTYPNPGVAKLKGTAVTITSLTSGNFLKYNGTNWVNSMIAVSDISGLSTDLSTKIDQSQIVGPCSDSDTLVFSSVSGSWTCTPISIADTQVTYSSQAANRILASPSGAAGVPTFRALTEADLPATITNAAWDANGSHVYRLTGNVGLGISSPTQTLDLYRSDGSNFIRIANASSSVARDVGMIIENYRGANLGSDNYFYFRNAQGSSTTPAATKNGNTLGGFYFQGQGTTAGTWRTGASILAVAATGGADFTDTNSATDIYFQTNNGAAFATRMVVDATGHVGIGTTNPATKLDVVGSLKVADGGEACSLAAQGGMIRYSGGSLQFCNGASWQTVAISGSSLTSLNGLTASTQTFSSPGTSGTAPAWTSSGSSHTLNIPLANASGVTAGLISKTQYDTFNAKLGTTLPSGQAFIGNASNVATARYIGIGDLKTAVGTEQFPSSCSASQTMVWSAVTDVFTCTNIAIAGSAVSNTPSGSIAATTVQTAINELGTEKVAKAGDTMTGALAVPLGAQATPSLTFSGDTDTGIYSPAANQFAITTAGTVAISVDASGNTNLTGNIGIKGASPSSSVGVNSSLTIGADANRYGINNALIIDNSQILTANRSSYGAFNDAASNLSDTNRSTYNLSVYGSYNRARGSTTAATEGAVTGLFGAYNLAHNQSSSTSTITGSYGSYNYTANAGTSTVTNAYGVYAYAQQNNAASTTGSAFGVRSQITNTAGTMTNAYTLYGAYSGTIGTKWGVYLTGEDKNYFSGDVGIGTSTPTSTLQVVGGVQIGDDAATCAAAKAGTIRYASGVMSLCNGSSWVAFSSTVGTVTNVATGAGLTGGPITSSGTISVATGGITSAMILDGTIAAGDIATDAVTASEIAANAVTSSELASNAVTSVKIADGSIVAADIAADAVTASEIAANAVTSSELASNAVTSAKIVDLTIVDADLAAALSNRIPSGGNGTAVWHTTGNFGIGTTAPAYELHVVGDVAATAFLYTSDRRLKKNIQTLENPLDKVLALRGVSFDWKANGQHDIGFIAQEVEEVVPAAVSSRTNDQGVETKSVKYGNLVGLVVEAVKELYGLFISMDEEVQTLKAENKNLKDQLQSLEERLNKLESRAPASANDETH